jgi:hypothetical protein
MLFFYPNFSIFDKHCKYKLCIIEAQLVTLNLKDSKLLQVSEYGPWMSDQASA